MPNDVEPLHAIISYALSLACCAMRSKSSFFMPGNCAIGVPAISADDQATH